MLSVHYPKGLMCFCCDINTENKKPERVSSKLKKKSFTYRPDHLLTSNSIVNIIENKIYVSIFGCKYWGPELF